MAQTISQALVARLGANLDGFKRGLRGAVSEAKTAGQKMKANFGNAAQGALKLGKAVALVGAALLGLGALAVREFVQWEEALTGVAKTVDATDEQIRALGQTFVNLSEVIPVSSVELAKLGEVAGQLGIELPNIAKFVETAAALGVSTNLMAEEAATGLARFSNVMGTATTDVDRLGSAIVGLGNNMATTEAEILTMALRVTGAGKQIGLTEGDVFGFSAGLSSLGLNAEAAGSAISRAFADMASSVASGGGAIKEFARVAGTSVSEFQTLFRKDAAEAVLVFIEGLNRVSESGEDLFKVLGNVGFGNIRMRDTFLRAAGGADLLRNAVEMGNTAFEENTALTDEAARFYDRTGARLVALRNKFSNVAAEMGEQLTPVTETLIGLFSGFLDRVRQMGPALGEFAQKASDSIPRMAETVIQSIGKIGLKLVTVVEFFRANPLAGGLGLLGLVFLGPTGAAALGTIGAVIDGLIRKLGGPTTVAEVFQKQLEDSNRELQLIGEQLRNLRTGEGSIFPEISDDPETLKARGKELTADIERIQNLIQGLTSEDFVVMGEEGSAAFGKTLDAARSFFTEMTTFQASFSAGGGGVADEVEKVAEGFETMRFSFAPLPLMTEEVTANLKTGATAAKTLGDEFKEGLQRAAVNLAFTLSNGIANALTDIIMKTKSVGEAMKELGQTIIREVLTALIRVAAMTFIIRPLFAGFGIALPQFADGGIVPGSGAQPIIAHAGEVVLSRETVSGLGGAAAANQLNRGGAPGGQNVSVNVDFPDPSAFPSPIDFGVIASNPDIMRLFSAMLQQARFTGTVV